MLLNSLCYQLCFVHFNLAAASKKAANAKIFSIIEETGLCFPSVASSSSDFLIIGVDRIADVIVEDEADVLFIDAHAKGSGGNDDSYLIAHKHRLNIVAFLLF